MKKSLLEWAQVEVSYGTDLPVWVRESRNGWLIGKSTTAKLTRGMVGAELKSCLNNRVESARFIDGVFNVWVESVFSPSNWR